MDERSGTKPGDPRRLADRAQGRDTAQSATRLRSRRHLALDDRSSGAVDPGARRDRPAALRRMARVSGPVGTSRRVGQTGQPERGNSAIGRSSIHRSRGIAFAWVRWSTRVVHMTAAIPTSWSPAGSLDYAYDSNGAPYPMGRTSDGRVPKHKRYVPSADGFIPHASFDEWNRVNSLTRRLACATVTASVLALVGCFEDWAIRIAPARRPWLRPRGGLVDRAARRRRSTHRGAADGSLGQFGHRRLERTGLADATSRVRALRGPARRLRSSGSRGPRGVPCRVRRPGLLRRGAPDGVAGHVAVRELGLTGPGREVLELDLPGSRRVSALAQGGVAVAISGHRGPEGDVAPDGASWSSTSGRAR